MYVNLILFKSFDFVHFSSYPACLLLIIDSHFSSHSSYLLTSCFSPICFCSFPYIHWKVYKFAFLDNYFYVLFTNLDFGHDSHLHQIWSNSNSLLSLCFLYVWSFDIGFFFSINHFIECAIFYCYFWNCIFHPYSYLVALKCLLLCSVTVDHVLLLHLVVGLCMELTHLSQSSSHPRLAAILLVLLSWFCPDFSKAIFLMVICEGCLMLFNIIQDLNSMHFLFLLYYILFLNSMLFSIK